MFHADVYPGEPAEPDGFISGAHLGEKPSTASKQEDCFAFFLTANATEDRRCSPLQAEGLTEGSELIGEQDTQVGVKQRMDLFFNLCDLLNSHGRSVTVRR